MMPSLSSKHSALARAPRIPRLFVIMVLITPLAVTTSVASIPLHLTSAALSEMQLMSECRSLDIWVGIPEDKQRGTFDLRSQKSDAASQSKGFECETGVCFLNFHESL